MVTLHDLTERTFRANAAYRYQTVEGLASTAVKELVSRPGVAGILHASRGEAKIVGPEVAVLYGSLQRASKLSTPMLEAISRRTAANVVLAALVLDGILEVESDHGFVSGAEAHDVVFGNRTAHEPNDLVSRLSIEALKYGQALGITDSFLLAGRLYCFNRRPASAAWKSKLPSRQAVSDYLGAVNGNWTPSPSESERPEWRIWRSNKRRRESPEGPEYKLYVSPEPGYLREALQEAVPALATFGSHTFKAGADLYGVLRPDKFVAYFPSRDRMLDAAKHIGAKLSGIPVQGVPFTASLDGRGIVSWGIDPPKHAVTLPWSGRSWRCWLADRLAAALVTARQSDDRPVASWEFALDRLSLDGVDTANWTLRARLWQEEQKP